MNEAVVYNYKTVRGFAWSAVFWLVIGLLVGLWIAFEMFNPALNITPWLSFGRLRVVHTNGLGLGFALAGIFSASYYMLQRLTRAPLAFPRLAQAHLYFFNAIIALGALSLFAGMNTTKEYAELEWPIDIGVVVFWVMFAVNVFGTLIKRREKQMYISLWYIIAMTVAIAILYIVNNLEIPVTLFKSYTVYSGANDANVEWWYGHNVVGFIFTVPILAMFYYFLPKSTGLPIYSHRLSIVSFWALNFAYLWTGAHHLMLTPLPEWIQTVAMAFSIFMIAPSWGSVVNGYYTLQGNWDQMRSNYLVKFFIAGITFYGLQTLQGPLQGLRTINAFFHYTDWVVGHVHMGTMGWVTMIVSASFYYMIPNITNTVIYSIKLANIQFWLMMVGQVIWTSAMWIAGIQQGAMWKATNPDGSLMYNFLDTVASLYPYYQLRFAAGLIFFIGILIFVWNLVMTVRQEPRQAEA
ncbi:cytochrome C oxidase Cbb3 [Chlorobium sp. BLA1]|uniref:cbb3-type cytochrome c oxidase subunit I n=2 Tax=Chlorobium TaxID=1091 RepID=UPI00141FC97E|nr:cbb3-type cytochrome c oxidase subunit I [Candidatus Chlorobium masyuteum]NHQ60166.1 cytochrome C oxidase Cbb3 [Candidatus Chlorobium masyuteum]NTU44571.1 cytochrome C oxidase Cbb3 [Chlorobiaceae bacterium]